MCLQGGPSVEHYKKGRMGELILVPSPETVAANDRMRAEIYEEQKNMSGKFNVLVSAIEDYVLDLHGDKEALESKVEDLESKVDGLTEELMEAKNELIDIEERGSNLYAR